MSRDDGFAVMDVSVDLVNDPKVRKLFRHAPSHAAVAFMAYVATMAESWRAGRRVNVDEAWPSVLPFSRPAVDALISVGLLDRHGLVLLKTWRSWYEVARDRRSEHRQRWRRANEKRRAESALLPRGNDDDTAPSYPIRSSPTVPPEGYTRGDSPKTARAPIGLVKP